MVGAVAWNLALWKANAVNMDVDGPIVQLSFQDVGSGVLAITTVTATLALVVTEQQEPAKRVVTAAVIAGIVTMNLDLFV